MMPKKIMNCHPCSLLEKAKYTTKEVLRTPKNSQGLNLPQRVRVLSIMLPMIGSFKASKTLAKTIMPVTAASCGFVRLRVNMI